MDREGALHQASPALTSSPPQIGAEDLYRIKQTLRQRPEFSALRPKNFKPGKRIYALTDDPLSTPEVWAMANELYRQERAAAVEHNRELHLAAKGPSDRFQLAVQSVVDA
jgi:hypothetical protein